MFIVKYIPEWFPGAGFKKAAREWSKTVQEVADVPFKHVKEEMVNCGAQVFLYLH